MAAISLEQQIDEIRRELDVRRDVYPRQVATGKMRQSVAEFQTSRLQAVLMTLEWLQFNEARIRCRAGNDRPEKHRAG